MQLVAWVLLQLENKDQDKHVESVLFPCVDESSNLSGSTLLMGKCRNKMTGRISEYGIHDRNVIRISDGHGTTMLISRIMFERCYDVIKD